MIFVDNLIGHPEINQNLKWLGSDRLDLYNERLPKSPKNWYYKNCDINYNINGHGHRSKQIDDLNFNDYILYVGCSITEGIGLELDKTYSYILSKNLNKDFYNLSVGGTGNDTICHNLMVWLNKFKKPKLIIVQITDRSRFMIYNTPNLLPNGWWTDKRSTRDFIMLGEDINYFKTKQVLLKQFIDSINVPLITVCHPALNINDLTFKNLIYLTLKDNARDENFINGDRGHPGMLSNNTLADDCLNFIKTQNWVL